MTIEKRFTVPLGEHVDAKLAERLEKFAYEYWLPVHVTEQQAKEMILDAFKRSLLGRLELLEMDASDDVT